MLRRSLLGFAVALLALWAVFWFIDRRDDARKAPVRAFAESPAEVVDLRVFYLGDSVQLLRLGSGRWITAGDSFPADMPRMNFALANLTGLQVREKVSDSADVRPLYDYGLDSAAAKRVEWRLADGTVRRVLLGKTSGLDFGSVYWMPLGGREVYRTPGSFIWRISSRARDWKDTVLFEAFRPEDVRAVAAEWRDASDTAGVTPVVTKVRYRVERADDSRGSDTSWRLTEPFAAPANRAEAEKLARYATQFKIDEFVPGEDETARFAALDAPVMVVRITLKDGSERIVTVGAAVDGLYRYVRHPSHKAPVRVFGWRFEYFRKRGEELVGK